MQLPPAELAWIGIIGGFIATIATIINLFILWNNRGRVLFHVITASRYYEPWKNWDIKDVSWPSSLGIKNGDCRRAYIVLEIGIQNKFPREITIGRFIIDGWIYSEKYEQGIYPLKRDYRVFNLHTREPSGMDKFVKIPPNGSYALRIEVFEDTDGPEWLSNHKRYVINLPDRYSVEFTVDGRKLRDKIKFKPLEHYESRSYSRLEEVYHWSDDLLGKLPSYGLNPPQGVSLPHYSRPWYLKLKDWVKCRTNWILYGQIYRPYNQPNRLSRIIHNFKRKKAE